jgi:hypothetical protein
MKTITHITDLNKKSIKNLQKAVPSAQLKILSEPYIGNHDYECEITIPADDEQLLGNFYCGDPIGFSEGLYSYERIIN